MTLAGHSPQGSGFHPRPVHVEFMVNKVVVGQVFIRALGFFIPPILNTHLSTTVAIQTTHLIESLHNMLENTRFS